MEDADGARVGIRSAKSQALLAMLATAQNGERSRAWLRANLWSDRAPKQASQSLRSELSNLRPILDAIGVTLVVDRKSLSLDLSTIDVVLAGDDEFLEGLDIRDEGFAEWLTEQRMRESTEGTATGTAPPVRPVSPPHWSIAVVPHAPDRETSGIFERTFADMLAKSLREIFSAPVSVGQPPGISELLIVGKIGAEMSAPGVMWVRFEITHPAEGHQIWSGHREIPMEGLPPLQHPGVLQLVSEINKAIEDYVILSGHLAPDPTNPDTLMGWGVRSLFNMTPASVIEADRHFEQAFEARPRGVYLSWRAQLRAIQLIERHPVDPQTVIEEGIFFFNQALEIEPNNSMVLATLANALRRLARDDERSLYLAERSVKLNPANPWAHWALSAARGYTGDDKAAYAGARVGQHLASLSPYRFWWDNQLYTAALLTGRLDEALQYAKAAHLGNPEFKPPLRYLIALHASKGNHEEAKAAARKLKKLEPDFSIERLLRDESYPASVIYKSPIIDPKKISDLE